MGGRHALHHTGHHLCCHCSTLPEHQLAVPTVQLKALLLLRGEGGRGGRDRGFAVARALGLVARAAQAAERAQDRPHARQRVNNSDDPFNPARTGTPDLAPDPSALTEDGAQRRAHPPGHAFTRVYLPASRHGPPHARAPVNRVLLPVRSQQDKTQQTDTRRVPYSSSGVRVPRPRDTILASMDRRVRVERRRRGSAAPWQRTVQLWTHRRTLVHRQAERCSKRRLQPRKVASCAQYVRGSSGHGLHQA